VLVVAATNRIDMIDSALIRPGRFDKLIYVPPLDKDGRLELLRICSKTTPISPDTDLEMVAAETEGYTGADLVNMIREVCFCEVQSFMELNY
jgi:transitional endoplasmic reticulum ATPase